MQVDISASYQNFDTSIFYDELFEYKNQNPLQWPALHYALLADRPDLANLALQLFPDEANALARAHGGVGLFYWDPPASFQDWDWFEQGNNTVLLTSGEVAAIYGYEDIAIELLQSMNRDHPAFPWNSTLNRERLYGVALQLGQGKLLNYLFSQGMPMKLEMPKMAPGPFWPLLGNQETMRVFLSHYLILDEVPERLVTAVIRYAAQNESPLQGAFNARNFEDFNLFVEMGLETFGQEDLELFQQALAESDTRYLTALCNESHADEKLLAAIEANRLDAVQALYPLRARLSNWPLGQYYDRGMKEIVSYLVSQGAVNLLSYDLLDKAILAHDCELVNDLLGRKGHYDTLCMLGHPLRAAVQANEPAILNRLLDSGFRVHVNPRLHNEIFFYSEAAEANASEVFQALMDRGLEPTLQDYKILAKKGRLPELKQLIERFSPETAVLSDLVSEAARAKQKEVFDFLVAELKQRG